MFISSDNTSHIERIQQHRSLLFPNQKQIRHHHIQIVNNVYYNDNIAETHNHNIVPSLPNIPLRLGSVVDSLLKSLRAVGRVNISVQV